MTLHKLTMTEDCHFLAITNDKGFILAAGAFTTEDDLETAESILYTVLCRLNFLPDRNDTSDLKLADLLKVIGEPEESYAKDWAEA